MPVPCASRRKGQALQCSGAFTVLPTAPSLLCGSWGRIVIPNSIARTTLAAIALVAVSPLAAQHTRVAPEGHVPPPATIKAAEWLVGDWVGIGIDGAEAAESWLPPSAGAMPGIFLQEKLDGSILFTEHMYMSEEAGSLVLKLKHFNPDMIGWEEKDGMVRFRLLAIEPCAAYFSALTYRCEGKEGLLVAVRMKAEGEKVNELVFRFKRRQPSN